jgi:hypothetical protein
MPKFRVRLFKTVQDILDARVEVEAPDEQAAMDKAVALAEQEDSPIVFEFHDTFGDGNTIEAYDCRELADD